jgi:transcriptional regulator with XRE-family HTH domain
MMSEIGQKMKEVRKRKGLSQEELAEASKINLRTIQRIENNESEPRGKTLHLLCSVLEINSEELLDYGKEEDSSFISFFHLSVISFCFIPIGNIIIPLILWLTKKDKIIGLKEIGIKLINFQISWTVLTTLLIVSFTLSKINHLEYSNLLFYISVSLWLINIILPIKYAIQSRQKNSVSNYPSILKIIK